MLVPPPALRDPTARLARSFPASDMRARRMRRHAAEEKDTTQRRSRGPRLSMTNPIACFSSSSLVPTMLPLTSSTVTRSTGARGAPPEPDEAIPGALACTRTAKSSTDASLARAEYSQCVASATAPPPSDASAALATGRRGVRSTGSSSSNTRGSIGRKNGWVVGAAGDDGGWRSDVFVERREGRSRHPALPFATIPESETQREWKWWEQSGVEMDDDWPLVLRPPPLLRLWLRRESPWNELLSIPL
nr:unnamed protein product [Digitaria exilis]